MPILYPEDNEAYFDAMARGETGTRLNQSVGMPIPQGYSPPIISPAPAPELPPMRLDSAANYVRLPAGGSGIDFAGIERGFANAPVDQAQKAINAAIQYQSQRGYNQDLQSGMSPDQALAKWAPLMLGRGGLTGAASMIRATQPKPNFAFVPGEGGAPATFQAPGQRPVVVPRSALPVEPGETGPVQKEEIIPGSGVYMLTQPGVKGFKIATARTPGLNLAERQKLEIPLRKDLQKAQGQLQFINKKDPQYQSTVDLINAIQNKLIEIKTPSAPMVTASSSGQSAPFKEGSRIRSKKDGKIYIVRNGVPVLE